MDGTGGGEGEGAWRREAQARLQRREKQTGLFRVLRGPIGLTAHTFLAGLEPSVRGGEEQGPEPAPPTCSPSPWVWAISEARKLGGRLQRPVLCHTGSKGWAGQAGGL